MAGWFATHVPYRPSPTRIVNRPAVSPAGVVAVVNGCLVLTVGLWWAAWGLALPMGALGVWFAVLAGLMGAFGAPWLLITKQLSGYVLLAEVLLIELWAWVTYVDHYAAFELIRDALVVGLGVVTVETVWLVAAQRVSRVEPLPHTPTSLN